MLIDLRNVTTRWINLDSATRNAAEMDAQFIKLGLSNHQRISARRIPPPNIPKVKLRAFGSHFVGCGQSHLDCMASVTGSPLLILEDDAMVTNQFSHTITVPDDTDAVYLGVSHGNAKQIIIDTHTGWYKIMGMLASHAILYLSDRYLSAARNIITESIYTRNIPLDNGLAYLQSKFNVLALPLPMFVQADSRESANKWEHLTSNKLIPNHKLVDDMLTVI